MRRRTLVINGTLALVLAGVATGAVIAVGDPAKGATVAPRTTTAAKGTVSSTVTATGNLAAARSIAVNFSGTGGMLKAVYVTAGQKVTAGQPLAAIDSAAATRSLEQAQSQLSSAKAQLLTATQGQTSAEAARDQASLASSQQSVTNAETSLSQAEASLALDTNQQNKKVDDAQTAYDNGSDDTVTKARASVDQATASLTLDTAQQGKKVSDAQAEQAAGTNSTIQQAQNSLSQANANLSLDTTQQNQKVADAQTTYSSATTSAAQTAALSALTQAQQSRDSVLLKDQQQVDNATLQLTTAQASLATSVANATANRDSVLLKDQQQVDNAQAQLDSAIAALATTLDAAKTARTSTLLKDSQQVQSAQGQLANAKRALASQQASIAVNAQPAKPGTLQSSEASVKNATVQVAAAQATLNDTTLKAPIDGTILSIAAGVGESSAVSSTAGTGFIQLANLSGLSVTTKVAEADASKVKVGQTATVTFSAANIDANGTVTAISLQDTVTNNVVEYSVTVALAQPNAALKIGQTASVRISTGSKADVIAVPNSALTTAGSRSTVTVRKGTADSTVVVEKGMVGDTSTEITSGVAVGDVLVLPTTAASTGTGFTFPGGGIGGIGGRG